MVKFNTIFGAALWCSLAFVAQAAPVDFAEAEAAAKKFTVPTHFVVRTWAAEPQLSNPVSFSFDANGRAFVAETYRLNNSVFDITQNTNWLGADLALETVEARVQFMAETFGGNVGALTKHSERLQMVSDTNGDGLADEAKTISEDFRSIESGIAAGVLAHGTNLWFTSIPDLWRFWDGNGDGVPEKPVKLHTGFGVHIGVTGHDLHGLTMGPDGRLYFSVGDRGFNVSTDGKTYKYPHMGGVLRCEPDGSNLEVFATGMRNPQELAFDELGNLFTGDNDTAGGDDCRLLYVVEHGDYGWRTPYQHLKDFGPWVQENLWRGGTDGLLPHSGNPAQGPSGLAFYPGTGLPPQYDRAFFMCDFPGGIWSFKVVETGASYTLTNKSKFIWNCWPTDVEFGPKGGIYFSDWVGGWGLPQKGRIYHATATGTQPEKEIAEGLRDSFEAKPASALVEYLSSRDYRIRQKAQFELARRGDKAIFLRMVKEGSLPAQIHSLWGLAQISRAKKDSLHWNEVESLVSSQDSEIRAQLAKLIAEAAFPEAVNDLRKLLRDPSPRVKLFAAQALEKLRAKEALPDLLELVRQHGSDPFLLHAATVAWRIMASAEELSQLAKDENVYARSLALNTWRHKGDPQVALFLQDAELAEQAARAVYDDAITNAFPPLAELLIRSNSPNAVLVRAIHANYRLGTAENVNRLKEFILRIEFPVAVRATAMQLLGDWQKPDPIDRVVGYHRPLPQRDIIPARQATEHLFLQLKQVAEPELMVALLETARKLDCDLPVDDLLVLFQNKKLNSSARVAALESMVARDPKKSQPAVLSALRSEEEKMRLLAAGLASKIREPQIIQELSSLARHEKSMQVRQVALRALQGAPGADVDELVKSFAEQMRNGTLPPPLKLEVLELIESSTMAELKPDEQTKTNWMAAALIAGGDAGEGARIFRERADVSCSRCHAVKGNGGTVGPDLTQIGKAHKREYLLESIQLPNKHIAKGFEQLIVQKKDGTVIAGLVTGEDDQAIELNSPEDGSVKIKKSDILQRKNALSAMPEGLAEMLTATELRHLVEYLATLK